VVNVITKKGYNLDKWTGVLEDNYFLQEKASTATPTRPMPF
jgi:iron complex outermembrane receptor protein/outer membrane receptor for ferrienterochelin and colicins